MAGWRVVEAVCAVSMVVGFPAWDAFTFGRLKQNSTHAKRMATYRSILLAEWLAVVVVVLIEWAGWGRSGLFLHLGANPLAGKILSLGFTNGLMATVAGGFLIAQLAPVMVGKMNPEIMVKIHAAMQSIAFLLPQGATERATFAAVAVTAGICEEVLYRGSLLQVFTANFGLNVGWSVGLAVLAFAVAHTYQGWKGIVGSGVLGAVFMALYFISGSLIPGILLHVLIDLRPLLLLPSRGTPFDELTAA